ncbi:MAG: helix-turn-helix domain-containing protein [Pseudomonadota bacterium]
MKKADHAEKFCPIARTLAVLEDSWSFLILRNAFLGARRFSDFERQLGLTRHLLSARLGALVEHGILRKTASAQDQRAFDYTLTEKGLALYPVIVSLSEWGRAHTLEGDGPFDYIHATGCGAPMRPQLCCSECGEPIGPHDVSVSASFTLRERLAGLTEEAAERELGYPVPAVESV